MNRTFGVVDAGELAACAWTLGIAHPTGYPTLTLLGWAVAHLSPLAPILSLNLLAAALTSAGVVALTHLFDHLLAAVLPGRGGGRRAIAGLGALSTGLAGAWWQQGTGYEVYCLHAALLPLVCWLYLRYLEEESAREAAATRQSPVVIGFTRRGHLFALVLGLSFTNHMTTGVLAPAFLIHYFRTLAAPGPAGPPRAVSVAAWGRAVRRWLRLAPAFLLGFVPPYAWLMLRAATKPRFNWGDPATPANLLHHLRGRDYGHVMGHFFDEAFATQLAYFGHWLPRSVGYLGLATGLLGLVVLWRRSRPLAVWSVLIFAVGVTTACSYNVNDISNYFMAPVMMVGAWSAVAAAWLAGRHGRRAGVTLAVALLLAVGTVNWRENDERGNTITEDFARNMLEGLPPNAIVFTQQWDFWESGSLYLQDVLGVRRDVLVIDTDSLHIDWYIDQLARTHPAVLAAVRAEAERVKQGARRIRRGELTAPGQVQEYVRDFHALVNAIIDRHSDTRPCFLTYDPFDTRIAPGYYRYPWRLVQRLTRSPEYLAADFPDYRFRMWRRRVVPQIVWTLKLYAEACQNRAQYEHASGREDLARRYAELALSFDPGFDPEAVPDFPARIEEQVAGELRRFARARVDLAGGSFPGWY